MWQTVLNTVICSISNPNKNPMIRSLTYFPKMTTSFITYALLESCSPNKAKKLIPLSLHITTWEPTEYGESDLVWLLPCLLAHSLFFFFHNLSNPEYYHFMLLDSLCSIWHSGSFSPSWNVPCLGYFLASFDDSSSSAHTPKCKCLRGSVFIYWPLSSLCMLSFSEFQALRHLQYSLFWPWFSSTVFKH